MHIHYDNRRRKNSLNWNKNFERPRKGAAIWFIGKQIFVFVCMWKQTSSFFVSMWKQIKCGFLCQCGSKLCFFWCQCGSKLCFCVHAKENCFWIHVETNFFSNFSVGMWSTHRLLQANVTFLGKSNKSFFCGKSSAPPPPLRNQMATPKRRKVCTTGSNVPHTGPRDAVFFYCIKLCIMMRVCDLCDLLCQAVIQGPCFVQPWYSGS